MNIDRLVNGNDFEAELEKCQDRFAGTAKISTAVSRADPGCGAGCREVTASPVCSGAVLSSGRPEEGESTRAMVGLAVESTSPLPDAAWPARTLSTALLAGELTANFPVVSASGRVTRANWLTRHLGAAARASYSGTPAPRRHVAHGGTCRLVARCCIRRGFT